MSGNGRLVAYELWDSLYTVPADGSGEPAKLVLDMPADALQPAVERKTYTADADEIAASPDGKQVALVVAGDVFVVARRGKDVASVAASPTVRVTATPARERDVAWSPDGKQLVYASDRHGQLDLFAARPVGREDGGFSRAARLRRDQAHRHARGRVAAALLARRQAAGLRPWARAGWRWRRPTAASRRCSSSTGAQLTFAWSPDSRWLAFSREDRQPTARSSSCRRPVAQAVNVSQHPGVDVEPPWSPDGRRLYWLSRRHARTQDVWAVYLTRADHERSPEEWVQLCEDEEARRRRPGQGRPTSKAQGATTEGAEQAAQPRGAAGRHRPRGHPRARHRW